MSGLDMEVKVERRLCEVKGETGYFHTWENYSKPLAASLLIGGEPAGVFSKIYGIVEFADGVRRVDPTDIRFCDEENAMLSVFDKFCEIGNINPITKEDLEKAMERQDESDIDMDNLLNLCSQLYKKEGWRTGGYLHIILDDGNLDDDSIRFCMNECNNHSKEEMTGLGYTICKHLLKLQMKKREEFYRMFWDKESRNDYHECRDCRDCRDCRHCSYDETADTHFCRRSYTNVSLDSSACDDFELDD